MKIAARSFQFSEQYAVIHQPPGYEVHHLALAFEHTMHGQQSGAEQFAPLRLANGAPDDHVDASGFVLERDENDAGRGVRACWRGHLRDR